MCSNFALLFVALLIVGLLFVAHLFIAFWDTVLRKQE